MGKTEKNKNGKGEDEILGREIPTVETAQSEKQKLVVEIDGLALSVAGEKKKLVEHGQETFSEYEELFGEFENKIAVLQKELADLQVTEKVQGVMAKIGKFRKKIKNLVEQAGDIYIAVNEAVDKVADKKEDKVAPMPVFPAVDTAPTPPALDKKEPKNKITEKFTLTKEGIAHLGDKTIDLSPLQASGHYDISINENGTVRVSDKDYPDTKARFQFDTDGKYIAYQQMSRGRDSGVAMLNVGQVEEKLQVLFPELRKDTGEMSFEGGILKTLNFSLDLNPLLDGGKCELRMENGVLYIDGKDEFSDTQAKLELSHDKKHIALKIRVRGQIKAGDLYMPDFAKARLESVFVKKVVKKAEPVADKKPAVEPVKKDNSAPTDVPPVVGVTKSEIKIDDKELKLNAEFIKVPEVSQDVLEQVVAYLDDLASDGNVDSDYSKWADILRTQLPASGNESDEMMAKRSLVDEPIFKKTLAKVLESLHTSFIANQPDTMIRLKKNKEKEKWENRKGKLFEIMSGLSKTEQTDPFTTETEPDRGELDIPVELGTPEEAVAGVETPEQKMQNMRDRFLDETSEKYLGYKDEIAAYKLMHPEAVKDGDDQLEVIRVKVAGAVADSKSISSLEALKTYFDGQNAEIDEYLNDVRRKRREKYFGGMEPIEAAGESEERTFFPETVSENLPETPAEDLLERFDAEKAAEVQRRNEILRDLHAKLAAARENLANAFADKEKAGGFVGSFKKMFGSKDRELSESRFNFAWNEYSRLQQELLEASEKQAEELAEFLQMESAELQNRLGEYYKGKENIVSKAWRKLGDLNLHNYLEKKGAEAKQKTEQGEALGHWDSFWANRAEEYSKSHTLYKLGAKAISARTVISLGLMGGGILGFTGAAEARGAFVGIGATVGSRQIQDAVQNKMQKWLGNRGEFYGTRSQAEEALRAKYGIIEKHYDEGTAVDEPEDKKTARRRAKFEKELSAVTEKINKKDKLSVAEQLAKVQEKIAAVEAYAYVNGLDLSKDKNYVRLAEERDVLTNLFLNEQAEAAGDMRVVIRPENLDDAREFLASRKAELEKTAQKIGAEKRLRWGKRVISVAVGATAGTFAYFATLSRAAAFGNGPKAETVAGATAGGVTEYGAIPRAEETTQFSAPNAAETPSVPETGQAIPDKFFVHKGDGLERVLQRQLLDDPQKFGYTEQMGDVKRWAGHEASVIAQKQGIADKYFIYNEKNPQYLVLNDDRTVTAIGRLHDDSEIIAAKVRATAEMGQEHVEKPVPVKEVVDAKTGEPKFMTDLEKDQVDKLWDEGKLSDAMQIMMDSKEKGPIFELSDGSFAHQTDIASADAVTATETLSASDVVTTGEAGALSPVEHVPVPKEGVPGAEQAKPADFDELVKGGEMKPLGSFDSRYGRMDFSYINNGEVASEFHIDSLSQNLPSEIDAAKLVLKTPVTGNLASQTVFSLRNAAAYSNVYDDMVAKGLGNSTEADLVKLNVRTWSRQVAEDLSKKPGELFKEDYLRTFGMKDEIIVSAETADEEAMRLLRGE